MDATRECDVLVIGTGPAGSTAAALLAREGRRVVMLERERLPRYHIGESLLPSVLPFLEELGVADEVAATAFHRKVGQTFVWGRDRTPWVLDFRELDVYPSAYFVERADFDAILARNAVRAGAELFEGVTVRASLREGDRVVGVRAERDGEPVEYRARLVIDASGQDAVLSRELAERRHIEGLRNLAVWSYWEGAGRLAPPADEHIITVSTRDGWVWFIPMRGGVTSVGVVTSDWSALRGEAPTSLDAFYEGALDGIELVHDLLRGAKRTSPARAARDWSYCASRFAGEGFLLAGDAACFIDPILSTGVHLAMTGGYTAALAANSALAEPAHEAAFLRYYQRSYAAVFRDLLAQVRHFYRVEAWRDDVFWKSKRILRADPRLEGSLAFVFLTSGLAQHVTSRAPHDVPGQVRAAFASKLGAGDGRAYAPRAATRELLSDARFVVTASDGRLLRVRQDGMRLTLEPVRDAPWGERPPRTAFLVELSDDAGLPMGSLLVERARPDLPERALVARRFAVVTQPYRWRDDARGRMAQAAARCERAIRESPEEELTALEGDVRQALRAESDPSWDVTEPAPLGDARATTPVLAEVVDGAGAALRVTVSARRAPEVHENPYWRGRLLDVDYHLAPPGTVLPTDALADAVSRVAAVDAARTTVSEALGDIAAALDGLAVGPWRTRAVLRMELPDLDEEPS